MFCKNGHDKDVVGTYNGRCKPCVLANISRLFREGYGKWAKIQPELDKCQLVCGSCHNIRTAARYHAARATTILPKKGSETAPLGH